MKATLLLGILVSITAACGSDSGKAADAPAGGGDAANMLTCQSYCTKNLANCSGTNSQWGAMADCMNTCSHWAVGTAADTTGDTLGCRIYHTMAAQAAPATHCEHAGPTGGGQCGTSTCATFCPLETAICPSVYAATGANSCATLCPGLTDTPPYNSMVTTGNTLQCRFYHLTAASSTPGLHCPHTAATGAGLPCS
jgi:hypothetical protein